MYMNVYMYMYMYVDLYTHVCLYVHVCLYAYVHVCTCIVYHWVHQYSTLFFISSILDW